MISAPLIPNSCNSVSDVLDSFSYVAINDQDLSSSSAKV